MKAQTLPEVIRAFDPMHPLVGQELKDWYIDRPGNPLTRMKVYLQGLGLANQPVKILFTGHVGSGKSTTLNKLAEDLKRRFFIVPYDVRQSTSIAELTYVDLMLGMATSLFRRATESDVLAKAPAQIASDVWDDIARFVEKVIFGPANFRTPPTDAELSAKVNFLAAEFQTSSPARPAPVTGLENGSSLAWLSCTTRSIKSPTWCSSVTSALCSSSSKAPISLT